MITGSQHTVARRVRAASQDGLVSPDRQMLGAPLPSASRRTVPVVLMARGARGLASGYFAVVLGIDLHRRGLSGLDVGGVLGAVVGGAAWTLLAVRRYADRVGRRRLYVAGHLAQAAAGLALTLEPTWWLIVVAGLLGTLSSESNDSGPLGALEQVMLASSLDHPKRLRAFGRYGAVGAAAGALGALGAGWLEFLGSGAVSGLVFLPLVPLGLIGAVMATRLGHEVEHGVPTTPASPAPVPAAPDARTGAVIKRLSALFAVDAFGSGFTVQAFVAYWVARRFDATALQIGVIFLVVGLLQTGSMVMASRLGARFGLLKTMVFTHLPSNALLASLAFAPNLAVAAGILWVRSSLSQMDVPTRNAYVMALVPASERTRAAATTGLARLLGRPLGALLTGVSQLVSVGAPFVIAGTLKAGYDLSLWAWFRHVPFPHARDGDRGPTPTEEASDAVDDPRASQD